MLTHDLMDHSNRFRMSLLDLLQGIFLELLNQLLDAGDCGTGLLHRNTSFGVVDEGLDGSDRTGFGKRYLE